MRPGPVAVEEVAAAPDAVVQDRITAALDDQLADKGLEPAKQGEPDVVVTFMARAATETELVEVVGEPPSRQGYGYTPIFPVETEQGALIVDVIDGSTGKLVWRAVAKAEDQDFGSPEFIRNAVREALDEFPPD